MPVIEQMFAAGFEEDDISSVVDLQLIKYFFKDKVNKLPFNTRKQLDERFRTRAGYSLETKGRGDFRRDLSEEQVANLLFEMHRKWLKEQNYVYLSAALGYHFAPPDSDRAAPYYKPGRVGRRVRPILDRYNNQYQGAYHLRGECSALAFGFLSLLWAFNFPRERLYYTEINGGGPGDLVCTKRQRTTPQGHITRGYYSVDEEAELANISRCSRLFEILDEMRTVQGFIRRHGGKRVPPQVGMQFAKLVEPLFSNCFRLTEDNTLQLAYRSPYGYHTCAHVKAEEGRPLTEFDFPYFDPLMKLRYKNGLQDLFEEYRNSGNCRLVDGAVCEVFVSPQNRRRRLYSIPPQMCAELTNSLFEDTPLADVRYTFCVYEEDDRPPGYPRIRPPTEIQDLTLFERLSVRYRGEFYIIIEEEDCRGEGMLSHPAKIRRFFGEDPAFNRQLSRAETKSDIEPRRSLSRAETNSDIEPRRSLSRAETKSEVGPRRDSTRRKSTDNQS